MTRVDRPVITYGHTLVSEHLPCVRAVFHPAGDNPLLPVDASDERGTMYGLDLTEVRPQLVEVIHSRPHVIRGNHVHMHCTETLTVLSGELVVYLACSCPDKHLLAAAMPAGTTVVISPGTPHALFTTTQNESIAVFDGDPRSDRDRVMLLDY
jgi:mannose-6-phosphate isomerase-like protein (cupin superfamily)